MDNIKCGYNTNTNRCFKYTNDAYEKSEFCEYNKKTGFCILKDKAPKICKKDIVIYDNLVLENICDISCTVKGLGHTTIDYLDQTYHIPETYDLKYGVLERGLAIVYNKDNYIHEIKVKNDIMYIYVGSRVITIFPNKNL